MLEFKNVDVSVGRTPILSDISVRFEEGKITSVVGPNGCGKTTLLQTLNGLSVVKKGQILLDGEDYLHLSYRERARRLSFMPQLRDGASAITVSGLVEHGRFPYMGFSRKMSEEDSKAVSEALLYTGTEICKSQMVNELSGGMQQRVYLAMQLAQNSRYMVMDEPMNYLDFPCQREMYRLICDLGEAGKTVILVLHDLSRALRISDRLVVMKDRTVVGCGTPKECLESGILEEVFCCKIKKIDIDGDEQYIIL